MIVRRIREGRGAVLIEWFDLEQHIHRGWVPTEVLNEDMNVDAKVLSKAAPYGIPFEGLLPSTTIEPVQLADSLRKRGLWTAEDILRNPTDIAHALISCLGFHASQVQTYVREFEQERKEV